MTTTTHPETDFSMQDMFTLFRKFEYNPVEELIKVATEKYTVEELTAPGRFTPAQLTEIANNDYYKYPFAARFAVHTKFSGQFDPRELMAGLAASTAAERDARAGQGFSWSRYSVEQARILTEMLKIGYGNEPDPDPGSPTPVLELPGPGSARRTAKRNGKSNGKANGNGTHG